MSSTLTGTASSATAATGSLTSDAKTIKWDRLAELWARYCAYVRGDTQEPADWSAESRTLMRAMTGVDNW